MKWVKRWLSVYKKLLMDFNLQLKHCRILSVIAATLTKITLTSKEAILVVAADYSKF